MRCKKELSKKLKFCKDCKFYLMGIPWERQETCKAVRLVDYDHARCWYKYGEPEKLNKNNTCKLYEQKWWKKSG